MNQFFPVKMLKCEMILAAPTGVHSIAGLYFYLSTSFFGHSLFISQLGRGHSCSSLSELSDSERLQLVPFPASIRYGPISLTNAGRLPKLGLLENKPNAHYFILKVLRVSRQLSNLRLGGMNKPVD